jgi:hypothetical protein
MASEITAATKIWRRMFQSDEQFARDHLALMKQQVAKDGNGELKELRRGGSIR